MSSYYNRFKDGASDKPKKKKKTRTGHPTWSDILGSYSQNKQRVKKINKKVKEAGG